MRKMDLLSFKETWTQLLNGKDVTFIFSENYHCFSVVRAYTTPVMEKEQKNVTFENIKLFCSV